MSEGPQVGTVYLLKEADYQFGVGALLIRVTEVIRATEYGGEDWFEVEALVTVPGTTGPAQGRRLYVRSTCLEGSRRAQHP
jgi:hypothetical protein